MKSIYKLKFKEWINEMTSTANVATFARPCIGLVRRSWPWSEEDPFFKKSQKGKKKPRR